MRCPFCHNPDTDVIDTRRINEGETVRRRRKCRGCTRRFTTYEHIELNLTVVKKNGEREPYNREKLISGVRIACYRRKIPVQKVEQLVNDVESVLMSQDGQEVSSSMIGDEVLVRLRSLDAVAYIRFASVYRSFADIERLREAVEELMEHRLPVGSRQDDRDGHGSAENTAGKSNGPSEGNGESK
jgi:transcriptional repressor NrdR